MSDPDQPFAAFRPGQDDSVASFVGAMREAWDIGRRPGRRWRAELAMADRRRTSSPKCWDLWPEWPQHSATSIPVLCNRAI